MELTELENILRRCDEAITENVRLNRNTVKILLTNKAEMRLNKERIRALFYIVSPFVLCLIIMLTDIQFNFTTTFYIGLGLFVPIYSFLYIWDVRYGILLCKINFTDPVLSIKKRFAELEKTKLRMNRIRYMVMPIIIVAILCMVLPKASFTTEFIIMLLLIGGVFVGSMYYTKYSIRERFHAINKEIEELESLEK